MMFHKASGRTVFLLAVLLIFTGHSFTYAQDDTCGVFLGSPYAAASEACSSLEPNQVCYGNPLVEAELSDPALAFEAPGDVVDISAIESLSLSPETTSSSSGGIVYLRLTDEEAGTDIYVVLYGVVTLLPDEDGGYIIETGEPPEGCTPFASGVLIYSAGEVPASIVMNSVTLDIVAGITHLATGEEGELVITVLEGSVDVTSSDETVSLEVDESTTVLLDEEGIADGTPSESVAIEADILDVPEEILDGFPASSGSGTENFMTFSPPDGMIVPTAGTWYLESYYVSPVPVCPGGGFIEGSERQPPPAPRTAEFDFSGGVSLEAYVEQLTGSVPPATYDNPTANVYTALGENDIEVTLYVISETEMVFTTVHTQVDCRVQTVNWWMLQE